MALEPTALTTLEAVKAQLELDTADTSQDELLEDLIQAATAAVETFCKRRFAYQENATETFRADQTAFYLRRPPLAAEGLVVYFPPDSETGTPLDPATVLWEKALGVVTLATPPAGVDPKGEYQVGYDGGFVTPEQAAQSGGTLERDLPRDVELAALLAVTALYRARGRDPNVTREALLSASQAFAGGWHVLSPAAQALLSPWRLAP